jgi:hypothetical protein
MRISEEMIVKFQKICKEEFGENISRADAIEKGTKLARLVEIVYKPITKKEQSEFLKSTAKNKTKGKK